MYMCFYIQSKILYYVYIFYFITISISAANVIKSCCVDLATAVGSISGISCGILFCSTKTTVVIKTITITIIIIIHNYINNHIIYIKLFKKSSKIYLYP